MIFNILHFDTLASTNTEAAEQARRGAAEGLCIVAGQQTAGRGRHGREWLSEKGSGVYMSIVLRPALAVQHLTLIQLMAAVAVYDVLLKGYLIEPDIKWPNDILVNDKKICGILSEAVETTDGLRVILGMGINLKGDRLPDNATSIEQETTLPAVRDEIVDVVTNEIARLYDILHATPAAIVEEWKRRSSYYEGKAVEVRSGSEVFTGVTCGLEENGALRVMTGGTVRIVQAGDVGRLRSA